MSKEEKTAKEDEVTNLLDTLTDFIECSLPAETLSKIIEAAANLIEEANFEFSKNGLDFTGMDTSFICLIHLNLTPKEFEHFECTRLLKVGIKLKNMKKVLGFAKRKDILTLRYVEGENHVELILSGVGSTLTFHMHLFEIESPAFSVSNVTISGV